LQSSKGYQKIVSLLPSATEILFELGLDDRLKGVTHACTYPIEALNKPKIINSSIDVNVLDSIEIDKKIKELALKNKPIFILNKEKIKEIEPDLIIYQNICEVCAPFDQEIKQISSILGYYPEQLNLSPKNIDEIFESIIIVGKKIGNLKTAYDKVKEFTKRIETIQTELKRYKLVHKIKKQKIICLEWISPFFIAGHWVPEMVEIIDGINGIGKVGSFSKIISINEIKEFDPDKIIIMPCGFDIERTLRESKILDSDKNWNSLKAVIMNEIFMVDANSYFSKPSPRIVTGIEIMAKIVYPELFKELTMPSNSFKKIVI
jgi:iron complex transport system substrate-binding protein